MLRQLVRILLIALIVLFGVALLATVVSVVANRRLPRASVAPARLSVAEQARLAEYFHLRGELGERVWPGFGKADIPVVLYNEAMVFLVGLADPAPGWQPMPDGDVAGGRWTPLAESVAGQATYSQPLPAGGATPQSFTVQVGDRWAASLTTMEWMRVGLAEEIRADLPPAVAAVFPYGLFINQLVSGSDQFISLIVHEAFHAFQGQVAPQRLAAAEAALREEAAYPWDSTAEAWQEELAVLAAAVAAPTDTEAARLAAQFLDIRARRRAEAGQTPAQIDFEQQREWLEGLARYAELAIWREALADPAYQPVAALAADPDFANYTGYEARWRRELEQMERMAGQPDEGRFYYSGMAIGVLLDRLQPGWKARALEPGVTLEGLLGESLGQRTE